MERTRRRSISGGISFNMDEFYHNDSLPLSTSFKRMRATKYSSKAGIYYNIKFPDHLPCSSPKDPTHKISALGNSPVASYGRFADLKKIST